MVEYILLDDARNARKGSFIAEVISLGEVTTGTSDKGAWSKQSATLKDNSSIQQMTLWNADIGQLDLHNFYQFENPYWTEYNGEPQVALGNYCKLHLANKNNLLPGKEGAKSPPQTLEEHQEADTRTPAIELPSIPENVVNVVETDTLLMLQIDAVVRVTMTKYRPNNVEALNNQQVGMFVKEIYRQLKNTNLVKASTL